MAVAVVVVSACSTSRAPLVAACRVWADGTEVAFVLDQDSRAVCSSAADYLIGGPG